ncbi:MAG TPA: VCBS domain-containing protein, partial [Gallionella sp.]|nr:VCBS domain-containing protein [Gallionella sp.]
GDLTTSGALTITDTDAGQSSFQVQTGTAGAYGTFTLDATGNWTYTANNAQTAIQSLGAGQTLTETFNAVAADGTIKPVTITITGTNDVPVFGGNSAGSVTEDVNVDAAGNLITSGALTISDADAGQSSFQAQTGTAGAYGTFTLDATGNWTYTANNAQTAIQSLGAGQTLTETFNAVAADGTTKVVTITINGTNDVPVAQAAAITVVEDTVATGAVTATDVDANAVLTYALNGAAPAGLTFNADGSYSFDASIAAYQYLNVGQSVTLDVPFTVTDDQGATSIASLAITVTGTNDAPVVGVNTTPVVVSETGLPNGLPLPGVTSATTATGQLTITDPDNTTFDITLTAPATPLTSGGQAVVWSGGANGTPLVGSLANGTEIIRVTVNNTGAYTVQLSGPVDHGGQAAMNLDFGVSVSDGIAAAPGSFTVSILDGSPVAGNMTQGIIETQGAAGPINLMIVIDKSASMAASSGIQKVGANGQPVVDAAGNPVYMTRFEAAEAAAVKLINDYVAQYGANNVKVNLMDFSSGSQKYLMGYWMTPADALAKLNTFAGITPNGGTNYDTALADAMAAFDATIPFAPQGVKFDPATTPNVKNVIYFMSDGLPTNGSGDTNTLTGFNVTGNTNSDVAVTPLVPDAGIQAGGELTAWTNFLTANKINAYALGMGATTAGGYNPSNLDPVPYLNPIAYDASATTAVDTNGMVITNLNQIPMVAAPAPVNGNILTANSIYAHGGFGADGGAFTSFTVDGVGYDVQGVVTGTSAGTFDAATGTWTINTVTGGHLVMHMATGDYTYTPSVTMNTTVVEDIAFTLTDRDGNTANGTYRLNVSYDGVMNGTAGNDVMIGSVGNDTIIGGDGNDVIIGGQGNDTLTGGLGADVFKWGVSDHGAAGTPNVDKITDFDVTATTGDKLDLRDLLQGESATAASGTAGSLDGYLHFETVANAGGGTDTIVHVSSTGGFAGGYAAAAENQTIVLQNVDLVTGFTSDHQIAQDMLTKGKLVTD